MKSSEYMQPPPVAPTVQVYPQFPVVTPTGMFPTIPPSYDEALAAERSQSCPAQPGFNVCVAPPAPPTAIGIFTLPFGPDPVRVRCSSCQTDVLTQTESGPNCTAHVCCLLLALMQCYLCSCLPYCMDSMKTVRHYCPNCNTYLGRYESS